MEIISFRRAASREQCVYLTEMFLFQLFKAHTPIPQSSCKLLFSYPPTCELLRTDTQSAIEDKGFHAGALTKQMEILNKTTITTTTPSFFFFFLELLLQSLSRFAYDFSIKSTLLNRVYIKYWKCTEYFLAKEKRNPGTHFRI